MVAVGLAGDATSRRPGGGPMEDSLVWMTTRIKPGTMADFARNWRPERYPDGMLHAYAYRSDDEQEIIEVSSWVFRDSCDMWGASCEETRRRAAIAPCILSEQEGFLPEPRADRARGAVIAGPLLKISLAGPRPIRPSPGRPHAAATRPEPALRWSSVPAGSGGQPPEARMAKPGSQARPPERADERAPAPVPRAGLGTIRGSVIFGRFRRRRRR